MSSRASRLARSDESKKNHLPATVEHDEFTGFPKGDWRSATATHPSLLAAVTDLRKLFEPRARYLRDRLLGDVSRAERQLPGVWVSLDNRLKDWQNLLLGSPNSLEKDLSGEYFEGFLRIAIAHSDLIPDPAWWAHAQMHALLGEKLGAFDDPEVGSGVRFFPIREFVKEYCDGPRQVDPEAQAFSSDVATDAAAKKRFQQWLLREDWQAPRGLWEYWVRKKILEPTQAWKPLGEQETERLLARIASDFWLKVESRLEHKARLVRITLAGQGISPLTAATSDDATDQESRSSAQVHKQLKPFDLKCGELMLKAREAFGRRFQSLPNKQPHPGLLRIGKQLDELGFRLLDQLPPLPHETLAKHNKEHPTNAVTEWESAIKCVGHSTKWIRRFALRRMYRAEQQYKKSEDYHQILTSSTVKST